jgi:hypothetical protein
MICVDVSDVSGLGGNQDEALRRLSARRQPR